MSDNPDEILQAFPEPADPEETLPFLALSSNWDALQCCRAEGKIFVQASVDKSPRKQEPPIRYELKGSIQKQKGRLN
jgi:hypothetical protein